MGRKKRKIDEIEINWYDSYKKVRRSWGAIHPATKIKESDKKYKRSKEKRKWKKDLNEEI